jgi:hypothetical protein
MRFVAKSLLGGVIIQAFLLLLLFVTVAVLPGDEVITDGLQFVIVSFMPAIFFLLKQSYDGPTSLVLILASSFDVMLYALMIVGFLRWREKRRRADEAQRRALKIT